MTSPTAPDRYITETDVAALLIGETLEGPETAALTLLIGFAAPKLRSLVPRLDQRVTAGALDREQVRGTLIAAVLRAFEQVRLGLLIRSEQYPEVQTTYAVGPDLIWFSDSEVGALSPGSDGTGGAFSIRLGPRTVDGGEMP